MTRAPALKFHSKKPRRRDDEAALQRVVVQHLLLRAAPGVLWFKITNEGKRSLAMGAEMKRQGLRPGAADLAIVIKGRTYFLELKKHGEKPTDAQFQFMDEALAAGADYAWADNINDALVLLERWGVFDRNALPALGLRREAA